MKPRIDRTNLKQVTIKAGKIFKFDVNIKGEPAPAVTWFLAEKEVASKDNVEIINVDYNTKLNVTDATRKNSGVYKIVSQFQPLHTDLVLTFVVVVMTSFIRHCGTDP